MEPYGLLTFILNYLKFRFRANSIHKVHSPFLFNLVKDGLQLQFPAQSDIESMRKVLRSDKKTISYIDPGNSNNVNRSISQIAKRSLKPRKFAELLAAISQYFKVKNTVELGTSLGITTAYLARTASETVYSFEGVEPIADKAKAVWQDLGISNVILHKGLFKDTLSANNLPTKADLIYIDGHHQKEPTLQYFETLKQIAHNDTVFVFDDIHWSPHMLEAWQIIQKDPEVKLSVDLYFLGLVFIKKELTKEHVELRF